MSYECYFDGHDICELFTVAYHMSRRLPEWEPTLIDVPGRTGAVFGGTRARPIEIKMTLCPLAKGREERQEALRTLAAWLAVDEPKALFLGDEGGRHRLAVPTGEIEIEPYLDADTTEVTFVCPDPRLFGEVRTVAVGTTETALLVSGTAAAMPVIEATATPDGTGTWKIVNVGTGDYMQVSLTTGASHAVTFDCEARTLTVDGNVAMLAPTCDWLTLEPGENELKVSIGTGTANVAWRDVWW